VEDQCDSSAARQVGGWGNSGPFRPELRVFEGYSDVGERKSCERGFQVENVPVNSQRMEQYSHSWLARYGK
jgi:hypothetical protein